MPVHRVCIDAASVDVKFVVRVPEYTAPSRLSPNITAAQVHCCVLYVPERRGYREGEIVIGGLGGSAAAGM